MKLPQSLKRILGGTALVAAFALVVSAALPGVASAHGGPGGRGDAPRSGLLGQRGNDGDTYLADALGISVEELDAAHEAAAAAALQQAVDEGLITQEQADAIQERSSRFGGKFMAPRGFGDSAIDGEALLAAELGISVDELQAAQDAAHDARIAEAVANGDLTQEQADEMNAMSDLKEYLDDSGLQDNIRSLREQAIQDAVDAGVITQEQADQILEGDGFGLRGGHGMNGFGGRGHGMRGHGMNNFGGQSFAPRGNTTVAPTSLNL